jgi:hypothetical protein
MRNQSFDNRGRVFGGESFPAVKSGRGDGLTSSFNIRLPDI